MAGTRDYNRQANGRFGAGNDGGPGRTPREWALEYLEAASRKLTLEAWEQGVQVMIARWHAGDVAAGKWLSENIALGKPIERHEISMSEPDTIALRLPTLAEIEATALPAPDDKLLPEPSTEPSEQ